jgi:DNA-binding HxlR family transcriptional regulator
LHQLRNEQHPNKEGFNQVSQEAPASQTTDWGTGYCPVFQQTMELLGRRWTGVILRCLLSGEQRFSELRRSIPGLSDRLLSERLDELEQAGLLHRHVIEEQVTYRLTERGEDLRCALKEVAAFAERWAQDTSIAKRPGRRCPTD